MSWDVLVAVLLWGASFVASKVALRELTPVHLTMLRTTLAAVTLDMLLLCQGKWGGTAGLTRREWVRVGLLVLISVFGHQLAQMSGLRQTTAINGALLITLAPLFILLVSVIFLAEHVTWLQTVGFIVALAGSALVVARGDLRALGVDSHTLSGDLLVVVSAGGWALYSTLGRDLLRERSPLLVVALVFSLSVPVLLALTLLGGGGFLGALAGLSSRGWAAVVFLAGGCSALAYVLWYASLRRLGAARVSVLQYLQPVVATALGIVLLGEAMVWTTVAGGMLILVGVALVNRQA